ncbi:DUF1638 domain-containing protein, partial [Salmonella enterica subsp. enterica]|nr:DUF1638 domain-containing protein [Salmonella enterica subsp. enterica]
KLVYLAQTDDPALDKVAEDAARYLGLTYERRPTGYGDLTQGLEAASKAIKGSDFETSPSSHG